jgi:histone-lysine N-methyltransferase SETMAR
MSEKRMLLSHNNARSHAAHATVNLLEWRGWEILKHLPYSPDLAYSNFHLFPKIKIKKNLAKQFKSHDDVKHELQTWLRGQDPTFYRQFEKWISCLDKCLNRGDYVEK